MAKAKAYVKTARGVQKSTNDALKKHNDSVKIRREELLERQEARDKKVEISADSDAKAFTGKPE